MYTEREERERMCGMLGENENEEKGKDVRNVE